MTALFGNFYYYILKRNIPLSSDSWDFIGGRPLSAPTMWCAQNYFTKSISHIKAVRQRQILHIWNLALNTQNGSQKYHNTNIFFSRLIRVPVSFWCWSNERDNKCWSLECYTHMYNLKYIETVWNPPTQLDLSLSGSLSLCLCFWLSVKPAFLLQSCKTTQFCRKLLRNIKLRHFLLQKLDSSLWAEKSGMCCAPSGLRILSWSASEEVSSV